MATTRLPWGIPTKPPGATNEHLLHQTHYVINYDDDLRVPLWVGYRLRKVDVQVHRTRTECFRDDPRLEQAEAAFCGDYDEPTYDRGHMVPNADMTRSEAAMINTYMFSNMVPQHDKFNRVIWSRLESYVRDWAEVKGEIYVITGAVFDRDDDGSRDPDNGTQVDWMEPQKRVAVPSDFYKIIFYERPNGYIETMTFLLPHEDSSPTGRADSDSYLVQHLTKIDAIEVLTGIDFLTVIKAQNPPKETAIEAFKTDRMWSRG